MRYLNLIILFLLPVMSASYAWSFQGWEARITVQSGVAEAGLSFGQRDDATDNADGKYDVPPYTGGTLEAVFVSSDSKKLWRDVKSAGTSKSWELHVNSSLDNDIIIRWNSMKLPADRDCYLVDPATGMSVDMKKSAQYLYINNGPRVFWVEIE